MEELRRLSVAFTALVQPPASARFEGSIDDLGYLLVRPHPIAVTTPEHSVLDIVHLLTLGVLHPFEKVRSIIRGLACISVGRACTVKANELTFERGSDDNQGAVRRDMLDDGIKYAQRRLEAYQ